MRILLSSALIFVCASSFAGSILINNHSFEDPKLSPGAFFYSPTVMPGWTSTATGGADRGIWNTTAPGKDGDNISFAYRNNSFAQQLTSVLEADTIYTMDYLIGRTGSFTTGTVELWAGGTVANGVVTGGSLLASKSVSLSSGDMLSHSFDFDSTTSVADIGKLLSVRMAGTTTAGQSYVSFDNVRLNTKAVPEPATLTLLGAGLGALLLKRRKKS